MTNKRAVLIGAGHNGLVCAFYLAQAGFDVTVFERRGVVGGAAVTEEFHPGFRNSVASYTVSLLAPKVIADMRLHDLGLRILERPISNFLPVDEQRYLKIGGGRTQAEIAKFSERDAQRFPAYHDMLESVANVLRELSLQTPPDLATLAGTLPGAFKQGRQLARLNVEQRRDLLALFVKSARNVLDDWFESNPIKAAYGFDAVVGHYASPDTPGSAYVLLHHCFGGVNGKPGIWGHAVGGMGAITQAMARACEGVGVKFVLDNPVTQVTVANGRASGVLLADGREVAAEVVASNVHPRLLFEKLVPAGELSAGFRDAIQRHRSHSGTLRMNVALSELPDFSCLPGREVAQHHCSGILLGPTLDHHDRAFQDARAHGWSREPIIEMLIPSCVDDSLAPPGAHVASLFCQQFSYDLPDGKTWDEQREAAADCVIDAVTRYAPNFKRSVLGRMVLSPLDLERKFGLLRGDIFHGVMSLDQLWAARPVLGHGDYRAPIKGLYMCGAGAHPGGGVTGMPGHNAAREILRDHSLMGSLRRRAAAH